MKVIFGTTNTRKIADLQNVSNLLKLNLEILGLEDINWNLGEIEENGNTLAENSLLKARVIFDFCKHNNICQPIITDDAGLFCEALNGDPGIYTARYAATEILKNPSLPPYQGVIKLLKNLENQQNRNAYYQSCVTLMMPTGLYFREYGQTKGIIAEKIVGPLKKPYYYAIFIPNGYYKSFNELSSEELQDTYRYTALKKILTKIK